MKENGKNLHFQSNVIAIIFLLIILAYGSVFQSTNIYVTFFFYQKKYCMHNSAYNSGDLRTLKYISVP